MKKLLKKYFLPHTGNNYHPHFFRTPAVVTMLIILVGSSVVFSRLIKSLPKNGSYAAVYAGTVIAYTNQDREANGDTDLKPNALLTEAAQMKANDMAAHGYFAHNSPEGKTSWYWFDKVGYAYEYAGENLAINFDDSKSVTDAWMASPTHRANLLHPKFTEIGVATAVGMYQGRETTFVVQMFGTPAYKTAPVVVKQAQQPKTAVSSTTAVHAAASSAPEEVAGAYAVGSSTITKIITSPRRSLASLYYLFIGLVTLILLGGAAWEYKKHHKGMWLAAGVLVLAAAVVIACIVYAGQGALV